jgi:hypothetical protein
MAFTKTKLSNLALSKIGSDRLQLNDFDTDETKAADQARLHYDVTLDELVRMHQWNCCKTRAKLTNVTSTDPKVPLFQFSQAHSLPGDYIRAFYVSNTDSAYVVIQPRVEWVIENELLLSNHEDIWLCYENRPSTDVMDTLFAKAFYTLLASKLATPLTGSRELEISLLEEFNNVVMPEARRVNGFEQQNLPSVDSEWLEATVVSPSTLSQSWPPFSQSSYGTFS